MTSQKNIIKLITDFEYINKMGNENPMERLKFCWELIKSDEYDFLKLHIEFILKSNKYLKRDLKEQFKFRNKENKQKVYFYLTKQLAVSTNKEEKELLTELIKVVDYTTLEQLKIWLQEIQDNKREDTLALVNAMINSNHFELHYNLIRDNLTINADLQNDLLHFEYGNLANRFLLDKLEKNKDVEFQGYILFFLRDLNQQDKILALKHAKRLSKSNDGFIREKAIIQIGWIGGVRELNLLKERHLNDENANCRAWAITSFMQIWFRNKNKIIQQTLYETTQVSLENEKNPFVLSCIIETAQEIEQNKFGIAKKHLDQLNIDEINKASKKIVRYIKRKTAANKNVLNSGFCA